MTDPQHRIVISDIDVPFTRLVAFFVKAAIAAVPATFVLWLVVTVLWFILAMMFNWNLRANPPW